MIPSLTPSGPVAMSFRCTAPHVCKDERCVKYLNEPGAGVHLFGVWSLRLDSPVIAICEGQLDTIVCYSVVGIPAVGICGAGGWRDWFAYLFEGYPDVVVLRDGDAAGKQLAGMVLGSVPTARVVPMPDGEDVSSAVLRLGASRLRERMGL